MQENKNDAAERTRAVRSMFGAIAPTYDTLNRILSFGVDQRWRREMVQKLPAAGAIKVLDLACGTGDVSIEILRARPEAAVFGGDLTLPMLKAGLPKIEKARMADVITFQALSAEDLPYKDSAFDAITIAFGIRNVIRRERALREMARVLKPEGKLLILDFSMPPNALVRALYSLYFHRILPLIGGLISGNMEAYKYLPRSVEGFPPRETFAKMMEEAGFNDVSHQDFTFGVSTLYEGSKC
ncbi:MAG: bifunctional demethylmenaquinone methyltransferase/2-methoxy-6-polyprenyl-1,4-benzoquinol methylase UbiE [Deltaproteobacteria bacterium]|nr:MAG: bifunctional demethylmenaquinone methyltransferase/2-methoxy-6-polyprenyl-1,4-benzoquinol methylase UbiE [Deltaproteobacteria bacterium]